MDYYLTQALTGHGSFRNYTKRIGKDNTSECTYCDSPNDNAEHTIFYCGRWAEERAEASKHMEENLTPENLCQFMIENKTNWSIIHQFLRKVMMQKEEEERKTQGKER